MPDRPYQARTIERIRQSARKGHKRILVVMPTGAGKGFMSARLIEEAARKENCSAFFADRRELIHQIEAHCKTLNIPARVLMSGVADEHESAAMFRDACLASLCAKDTLYARAFKANKIEPPDATFIQVDEAHGHLAKTWQTVTEYYDGCLTIGWTATPCRTDGRGLGDYYTDLIIGATYSELQRDGYLVPCRVFAPDRPDLKGLKISRGDYQKKSLEQRMNRDEMVGNMIAEWREHADGRSTVVMASGVQHSIHCRNEFRKKGVIAEHLDGNVPDAEREDIIGRVRDGEVMVLCNYDVVTKGVDVPRWKYLICARPTKSFVVWRQFGGRGQRPFEGQNECVIQDHSDNALHFGYPDEDVDWELSTTEKIQEAHAKKQRELGQKDPYLCEKCRAVYRGPTCPQCGHRPERVEKAPTMADERLKELDRKRRAMTLMDKQKLWDECLGWAIGTNRKIGAAAHRYKREIGAWPEGKIQNVPRSSQWRMMAREFYNSVVKPEKEMAAAEAEGW